MSELDDFDFASSRETLKGAPSPDPGGGGKTWIVAGVLTGVLLGGLALFVFRHRAPGPAPASTLPAPTTLAAGPSPSATPGVALPTLDESDAFVRDLAKGLSASSGWAAWLAARDLVRTATVVVENVANGDSPRPHLLFLAPKGNFDVVKKRSGLMVDPKSYERYDAFTSVVASLDPAACAKVYSTLAPLFEVAYKNLGHPEGGFSRALERAAARLVETPLVDGDVAVRNSRKSAVVYELVDPRLEGLSVAQKHVLRMGPRNGRKLQAKVREIAQALGLKVG